MIFIRQANRDDFALVMDVMKAMAKDNAMFSVDWKKVAWTVADLIDNPTGYIFLAFDGKACLGSFAVEQNTPWYSTDLILDECWIFVRPEYRKTRAIFHLLESIKGLAQKLGLPVQINVVTPNRPDAKVRLFKRYFKMVGESNVQIKAETNVESNDTI